MARKLSSWIDGFVQYTTRLSAPTIFSRWTALFIIGAALERKVWTDVGRDVLYPNMFVFLIGPPGAGKTIILDYARHFLNSLEEVHIAPTSVSKASLMDALNEAERTVTRVQDSPPVHKFNSLSIINNELGTLISEYDQGFINVMTDLWDCRIYSESRRTKDKHFAIENPQINFLAGTTPSFLQNLLPPGAWDQGFMSRVLSVFSGASAPQPLFTKINGDAAIFDHLSDDLKDIFSLWGYIDWSEEAAAAINEWHMRGGPPIPDHPRLSHYKIRRTQHLAKLCMIVNAANGGSMQISLDDYAEALDYLIELETFLPDIFKAMNTGGDTAVMQETWHHVWTIYMKENSGVAEHRVINFISQRTPAYNIMKILEAMCAGEIFSKEFKKGVGMVYVPKPLN